MPDLFIYLCIYTVTFFAVSLALLVFTRLASMGEDVLMTAVQKERDND